MSNVKFIGGDKSVNKIKALIKAKQEYKGYEVGFFINARYLNGESVAMVAFRNEYGIGNIPERPFFRLANRASSKKIFIFVKKLLTFNDSYVLSKHDINKIGQIHQLAIVNSIIKLREPPNADSTIKAKGSSNPLYASGMMSRSVTYKVF